MKQLFFITTIILSGYIGNAQHVAFGLKGGINISNAKVSNSGRFDSKISPHVGGLAHIHLTKEFAIQPELVFSGQGFKTINTGNNNDVAYRLNYLNVPVLVQYMFNNGIRIESGPQVGLLLSAKNKSGNVTTDIKNAYKDIDFAWAFGAGYLMHSGLGFDARINLGIAKINDDLNPDIRNGVIQLGVFYQFNPRKH